MKSISILALLAILASILFPTANAAASSPAGIDNGCNGLSVAIRQVKPASLGFQVVLEQAQRHNCPEAVSYAALAIFYASTQGLQWTERTGWLGPKDPCTWYGVSCTDQWVTGLSLANNHLAGRLPPEISLLTGLQVLILPNNLITGPLPAQLGSLTGLVSLDLSNNPLGGEIPSFLGGLANLTSLKLAHAQLSGAIPPELGSLSALTTLDLSFNALSGALPPELASLSALTTLDLSFNALSGALPPALGNLTTLHTLALSGNQLTGAIPVELGSLPALAILQLDHNQLSGQIPSTLASLTNLQVLDLARNQLAGPIPLWITGLYNLSLLNLEGNAFTGTLPIELGSLYGLHGLKLADNQISGTIPPELGYLTNLAELTLAGNSLKGALPFSLANLPLNTLTFSGALCEPADGDFQNWLNAIPHLERTQVTCNIPVVILPGVMGSRLYNNPPWLCQITGTPTGEVWGNTNDIIRIATVFASRILEVEDDGATPVSDCSYIYASSALDTTGTDNAYQQLADWLRQRGYDVRFFSYDWRRSLEDNAVTLDAQLNAWGYDQVYLVGHSMGGMLARTYVKNYPQHVLKAITVGAPYLGAPELAYKMRSGELPIDLGSIRLGLQSIANVVRNSPGIMELLPGATYIGNGAHPFYKKERMDGLNSYTESFTTLQATQNFFLTDIGANGTANATRLQQSEIYHALYDDLSDISVEYHILSGNGLATPVAYRESYVCLYQTVCIYTVYLGDGDATVPARSARGSGSFPANVHLYPAFYQANHSAMVTQYNQTYEWIGLLLQGSLPPTDLQLAAAESLEPRKLLQISVLGPADVTVTDPTGTTSGPAANLIPGVTYLKSATQTDVIVPAGQAYTVTFTNAGEQPLNFTVIVLDAQPGADFYPRLGGVGFSEIPLNAGSATLNLEYAQGLDNLRLSIDQAPGQLLPPTTHIPPE